MDEKLIGNNLKFLRIKAGLNQSQMGTELFSHRTTIQKYEGGRPTLEVLIRYKERFNVSLDDLCFTDLSINPMDNQ